MSMLLEDVPVINPARCRVHRLSDEDDPAPSPLLQNRADRIATPSGVAIASAASHSGMSIRMRIARGNRGGWPRQGFGANRRLGAKQAGANQIWRVNAPAQSGGPEGRETATAPGP